MGLFEIAEEDGFYFVPPIVTKGGKWRRNGAKHIKWLSLWLTLMRGKANMLKPTKKFIVFIGIVAVTALLSMCRGQSVPNAFSPLALKSPFYEASRIFTPTITLTYIPTPPSGRGVVVGRIVTNAPDALVGLSIFLGDIVVINERTHAAFLNKQQAPIGRLDTTSGWFVFTDVNPGLYALIISEPEVGSWVYMTPEGDIMVIEVFANEVTNLGEIPFNP